MNIESKFGLKDSLATAVILAVMLFSILGTLVRGVDDHTPRAGDVMEKTDRSADAVLKLEPIIVTARRLAPGAEVATVASTGGKSSL